MKISAIQQILALRSAITRNRGNVLRCIKNGHDALAGLYAREMAHDALVLLGEID